MHQRVRDLQETLWEVCDKKREDSEAEHLSIIEDRWVEDYSMILVNVYILMMQAEVDRYHSSRQIICDYFQDSTCSHLTDTMKIPSKIPLVTSNGVPPIDVYSIFVAANAKAIQKQDILKKTVASPIHGAANVKESKKTALQTKTDVVIIAKPETKHGSEPIYDKEPITVDYENAIFADIQAAVDFIYNTSLNEAADHISSPSKGDKLASKSDHVHEEHGLQKAIETEDRIFKANIERIKGKAIQYLKEFRNKSFQTLINLDNWIGVRFLAELSAVKDLVAIIKEAIETEQKLPNKLILEGDKAKIDFRVLVCDLETEDRPKVPAKKYCIFRLIQYPSNFHPIKFLTLPSNLKV